MLEKHKLISSNLYLSFFLIFHYKENQIDAIIFQNMKFNIVMDVKLIMKVHFQCEIHYFLVLY